MTEIEKMYENAGINKSCHANIKFDDCIYSPSDCGYYNYPDFTAEKQIELIKLLGKRARISLEIDFDNETYFYSDYDIIDGWFKYQTHCKTFEEALAQLVNNLWQDLTDQEKEEIRGILNE